jgi:2-amino-4-hydroxy-6-hydroxymethyldihydropteridine diphosphokinase
MFSGESNFQFAGGGGAVLPVAFVALGSNLGDSRGIVRRALERLKSLSAAPLRCSGLWETEPVDCPPGSGRFINAVAALTPLAGETPETLLEKLQAIEREFGRRAKRIVNEARPLDLDLIAFGGRVVSTAVLTLPHPRAHERRFVLGPLSEIAPEFVLPGQRVSVRELLLTAG